MLHTWCRCAGSHCSSMRVRFLLLPLQVCTNKMNLGDEVDLEDYVSRPDKISAAEISAICQEAGMHAVSREGVVSVCSCSSLAGGMLVGHLLAVHSVGLGAISSTSHASTTCHMCCHILGPACLAMQWHHHLSSA